MPSATSKLDKPEVSQVYILKANPHGYNTGIDLMSAILEKARQRAAQAGLTNYVRLHGDAYNRHYADRFISGRV